MSTEGAVDHDWEDQVAQGLQLVVQHCPTLCRPQDLCSLLQVSTTIRRAVQQSRGHCSIGAGDSVYLWELDPHFLDRVEGMAAWLTNNSGLVSDLHLKLRDSLQSQAAQQALTMALRQCAGMAAAAAAAAQQSGQLDRTSSCPPPLRLTSFHTDVLCKPAVLQLLPSFGVKSLSLEDMRPDFIVCAALARITTLQQLQLPLNGPAVPQGLVEALGKLQGLTHLRCSIAPGDLQLLPASLRHLEITVQAAPDASATFSCSHLTALQDLRVWRRTREPLRIVLPPKVQHVVVRGSGALQTNGSTCLQGLREVQELYLTQGAGTLDTLQLLPWVTSPFSLSLNLVPEQYAGPEQAQLPIPAGRCAHAEALSVLTAVTRLSVRDSLRSLEGPEASWCAAVLPLRNLRDLYLDLVGLPSSDLVQLSALTALTKLDLRMDSGLDDATAAAILEKLTNLQDLSLQGSLQSWDGLPVLAQLTSLRTLRLICKRGLLLSRADLLHLSSLTQLEYLTVPLAAECNAAVVRHFLAGMPHLDRIV